jgi:hypothetical protein
MPKVNGLLFSTDASGSVADLLTFRSTKRGNICTHYSKPTGKPTTEQDSHRELFAQLAAAWALTTDSHQQSWTALAEAQHITNYNAYLSYNFKRLTQGLSTVVHNPPIFNESRGYLGIWCLQKEGAIAGEWNNISINNRRCPSLTPFPTTPSTFEQSRNGTRLVIANESDEMHEVAAIAYDAPINDAIIRAQITFTSATTEIGLFAKAKPEKGIVYTVSLNPLNSYLSLVHITDLAGNFVNLNTSQVSGLNIHAGDTFNLTLETQAIQIHSDLYTQAGEWLASVEAFTEEYD